MRSLLILSLVVTTSIFVFESCDLNTPESPGRTNPFDTNNPDGGDPYHLQAEIADGGIRLTWQDVDWEPLTGYAIYRKDNDNAFKRYSQVYAITNAFTDRTIQNGHSYEYYVVAMTGTTEIEASNVVSVTVNTHPVIFIEGENVIETPTRHVELTMIAYGAQKLLLSNTSTFAGAQWEEFSTTKDWQLPIGEGRKIVYMRVIFNDGDTSDVVSDTIEPQSLTPSIIIEHDSTYTPTRHVELQVEAEGATQMKLSNQPIQEDDEWQEFIEIVYWDLTIGESTKTVYINVRNDFLIEADASDQIEPQVLSPLINISPDSAYINHCDITLLLPTTGAIEMRLSNTSDTADVNWQN